MNGIQQLLLLIFSRHAFLLCVAMLACTGPSDNVMCLQVLFTAVYSIEPILSMAVSGGGAICCSIGLLLLKVTSSTMGVVG